MSSWFWSQYSVILMPRTSSITKKGRPDLGRARIEHLGDVGMVHQRQRLTLGLEPGDDRLGVHAQLDDFERHAAAHRLGLLGHIDHPAAAFADFLQHFVTANDLAHGFVRDVGQVKFHGCLGGGRGLGLDAFGLFVRGEQRFDARA